MAEARRGALHRLAGGSGVTVAVAVMNVTAYAFTIVAARWLGPSEFGAVGALMGLLLVLNVAGLALQTTGARRVSTCDPADVVVIARRVMTVTYVLSLALGLATLAAAPLVSSALDLDSIPTAALLGVTVALQTFFFGQAGVIQGERRWAPLAWLYAVNGGARFVFGLSTMAVRPDAFGAMLGVALGALAPVAVGTWALRSDHSLTPAAWHDARAMLAELGRNARALLAFLGVSNADMIVARLALPSHDSGLYAGGLILTKAVLFLPQFLIVLGFPTMAAGGAARAHNHPRALAALTVLGLGAVAGTAVLPSLALHFVGGSEYAEIIDLLWLFALLGLVLSLVQFLVYDAVARQDHRVLASVWVALALLAASVSFVDSVRGLLVWALVVDSVLCLTLLVLSLVPDRSPDRLPASTVPR
jgi:O-antigen/teichoic acid export membrane protein